MSSATVSSKGQITLRKALGLKAGDKVELSTVGDRTLLTKARKGDFLAYTRQLKPTLGPALTDHQMDVRVAEEVSKDYARKRREGKA